MTKADPIIAVKDVDSSAKWYETVFGFKNASPTGHGFAVLKNESDEIVLCLHAWQMDNHPTMKDQSITPGNGLLLYFRTPHWEEIYKSAKQLGWPLEEDIHVNPGPKKKEFSLRDPDGYFLTVSEYHEYEG